jgi:voltage-gated potassium channel
MFGNGLDSESVNDRIHRIIDFVIIIWIVADIILLTSTFFINLDNVYYLIVIFDTALCAVLIAQFILNLNSKENKMQYIREDWKGVLVDVIAMMPYELFTFGSFGIFRLLRLVRIFALFGKGKKNIYTFIEKTKLNYIFMTLLIIIVAGSIAILVFESSPTDEINTPMDAAWYVISTITTVGYGDTVPVSFGGRILGIILMIVGVVFFSLLTASLSSWFMRGIESEEEELKNKIVSMEKSMSEMRSDIKEFKELLKKRD